MITICCKIKDGADVKSCFLYCAGEYYDGYITPAADDAVVAVDGGFEVVRRIGVKPTLAVGDFDSLCYVPEGVEVIRHPTIKDDTDTVLAARYMLSKGCDRFYIFGAFGKRLDHSFANLQLLTYLSEKGVQAFAFDDGYTYTALHNARLIFPKEYKGTVSSFSQRDKARSVSMKGLKYPLCDATLYCDNPMGVSNEFIGQTAEISVKSGTLLIMFERKSGLVLPQFMY